ncbi:unnamed protein product [Ascophyllum nodosum]
MSSSAPTHFQLDNNGSLDAPAGVTQEERHTWFLTHLPSAHLCRLFCRVLWFQDGRSNSRAPPNDGTFQDSVEEPARCAGGRRFN